MRKPCERARRRLVVVAPALSEAVAKALGTRLDQHGPEMAFGADGGERSDPGYRETILQGRLHDALARLNPALPVSAVAEAYCELLRVEASTLVARNRALHRMIVDGVNVEYTRQA